MRGWLFVGLAACGGSAPLPVMPTVVSIGCLEVSVERVVNGPVLDWRITNTCDHAVPLDLAQARVFAIGPLFERIELVPQTRRALIAPGWIEGGTTTCLRVAYAPQATNGTAAADSNLAIEVELTAFYELSHRPVIIATLPEVAAPRSARLDPEPMIGGAP
jgi:hypothetical protein